MTKIKPITHTVFFDNSSQIEFKYRTLHGKLHGKFQKWDYEGNRQYTKSYKNDIRHGIQEVWYKNGQKAYELNYTNGYPNGPEKYWHPDGKLQAETIYSNGKRHGMERSWDEKGGLSLERYFENGKECWRRCWNKEGNLTADGAPRKAPVPIPREIRLVSEYHENIKTIKKLPLTKDIKVPRPK